ncbi:hypothetical protein ACWEO1_06235 [Kitasatospora cineracea]
MNDEQRRAILGGFYEQVRREAHEAAEQAPPFTEEQKERLRAVFRTSPGIQARRTA